MPSSSLDEERIAKAKAREDGGNRSLSDSGPRHHLDSPSRVLLSSSSIFLIMVSAKSSNERAYVPIPTNARPPRRPVYRSTYSNGADSDQPPMVPPKDPHHNPVFVSPVSTSFPPDAPPRARYTSFSVYEPQSASMPFPEPRPHRLASRRSVFGLGNLVRPRASKSDMALGTSTESLWGPNSNRGSYATTVFYSFCFV